MRVVDAGQLSGACDSEPDSERQGGQGCDLVAGVPAVVKVSCWTGSGYFVMADAVKVVGPK